MMMMDTMQVEASSGVSLAKEVRYGTPNTCILLPVKQTTSMQLTLDLKNYEQLCAR